MRSASVERNTKETRISATVALDGGGESDIATGIGFLDHMLEQLSRHSLIDITLRAEGDLHIDGHHTVEDVGITLGQAFARAVGEYGSVVFIAGNMPLVSEIAPLVIITKLEQYDIPGATAVAVAMLALMVSDLKTGLVPVQEVASASLTQREHVAAAQFVRTYFRGQGVVVNDVGAMAYYSDADVLDMFGLCAIEPVLERRAEGGYDKHDVALWTDPLHPRLAIVQLSWGWVAPHVPDAWRKAAEVRLEPEGRVLGFYAIADDLKGVDLRADIAEFYGPLAARYGYQIQYF